MTSKQIQTERNKYIFTGIDICKLIAAILVVLLHTIETGAFFAQEVKYVLTLFAVPFFFIASGYFFYHGLDSTTDQKAYFLRYEKNLLAIFAVWALVLYSPFVIADYVQNNPDAGLLRIALLLFRRIFVIGPGPYWYLAALMWTAAFLYLCYIKGWDALLLLAMIAGFLAEISYACFRGILSAIPLFRVFHSAIYTVYSWEFNCWMFGIPFAGIGYFICKKRLSFSYKKALMLFVCMTLLRILEYNLRLLFPSTSFWANNEISFAFKPQAIAFFLFAKEWSPVISKQSSLTIRQLSSFIYFAHAILLYDILDQMIGPHISLPIYAPAYILPKWLLVLTVCCILFAMIKRINNKHLNFLIRA